MQKTVHRGGRNLAALWERLLFFLQKSMSLSKHTFKPLQSGALFEFCLHGAWRREIKKLAFFAALNTPLFDKVKDTSTNNGETTKNVPSSPPLAQAQNKPKIE